MTKPRVELTTTAEAERFLAFVRARGHAAYVYNGREVWSAYASTLSQERLEVLLAEFRRGD